MTENKLIKAYDDLMGNLYEALDDTLHSVAEAMEIAKEKTSALGGHTQEEINKIADLCDARCRTCRRQFAQQRITIA